MRVASHLEGWFAQKADLKETLESMVNGLWEQTVIAPMLRLTEESEPTADNGPGNVISISNRAISRIFAARSNSAPPFSQNRPHELLANRLALFKHGICTVL